MAHAQELCTEARPPPPPPPHPAHGGQEGGGRGSLKRREVEGTWSWATGDVENGRHGLHVWVCSCAEDTLRGPHGQAIWSGWEVCPLQNMQGGQQAQPQSSKKASLTYIWPNRSQSNE